MHGLTEADRRPAPRMSESRKERRTATPEAAATAAVVIDILGHTVRSSFSETSAPICNKGFKVVSRPVSCQRRYCQWSLDLTDRMHTDTGVVMMREVCFQKHRSAFVIRVSRWFQGWFHANDDIANGVWISRIACTQTRA